MLDLTITSLETITCFALNTGNYLFTLDELQNASIANTEEKVDITGKQGRKLNSLKRNKAATVSGANGMISGGLIEMQTGGTFETKSTDVMWRDFLTVQSNAATTKYKAIGTAGAEISELYILTTDGTAQTALEQDASAAEGKFAYAPETKVLSFSGLADGTEIAVLYKRKISAETITNNSDTYAQKCEMYLDAMAEDKCSNIYHVQFHFPKVDFSGEFTIDLGDDQAIHNFEAECLAGACGAAGKLWDLVVFGENAEDVA